MGFGVTPPDGRFKGSAMPRFGDERGDERYLIEFRQIGASVKVSAIDPATDTEVSIVGPANASRQQLVAGAVAKLEFILNRKK